VTIALAEFSEEPSATDGGLVVAVQAPTRARAVGFERVYAAHYGDVYRYVLGLTRSADDAEEITADTFERAMRSWSALPERPIVWLLLTARRLATDRWRRARRLARILIAGRSTRFTATAGLDPEFDGWFASLAAVLTTRQREVLVLRYQRDLTDADIASVMGLSESGVRSLVSRALAVLRLHPELLQ
jgi:RNA polymerase sigma-70 factor (ECF subfamily)